MNTTPLTVGELVAERPSRSRLFEELGIDYCCGGKLPLAEACARKGLDAEAIQHRLALHDKSDVSDSTDWRVAPLAELSQHIVATHHAFLRRELPRLGAMLAKLARVHGDRHPELRDAVGVFIPFAEDMDHHMMKEEQVLFPLISRIESGQVPATPFVLQPIRVMESEHDDAGRAMEELRRLTDGFTLPPDGCNTYRATMAGLRDLEEDLHTHVHKENNILFPRVAQLVTPATA